MSVSFEENFPWQPSGPVLWPTLMGAWRGVDPHWMPKERLRDLLSWESAFFSNSPEIFSFVRLLKVLPVENIGPGPRWVTTSKPRPVKHLLPCKRNSIGWFHELFQALRQLLVPEDKLLIHKKLLERWEKGAYGSQRAQMVWYMVLIFTLKEIISTMQGTLVNRTD